MTDIEQREPVAAYTVDLTGCEHLSRDVANIERIAAAGSEGPTAVHHLYTGQQLAEVEERVEELADMVREADESRLLQIQRATTAEAEAERLRALVEEAKRVLEPFADKSKRFDDACRSLGEEVPKGSVKPITEFTHAHLRAARALRDRLGVEG